MKTQPHAKGAISLEFLKSMRFQMERDEERRQILHLFGRRAEASVRLAYHLTRDREAALDLSQEAFVRALETLGTLEDSARIEPWFNRIVVNLCRDWLRRRGAERKARRTLSEVKPEETCDPALRSERREETERTRQALMGLPLDYREALVLVSVEGLNPKDAAFALNVPEGTLRWRLHEGRRLIREILGLADTHRKEQRP